MRQRSINAQLREKILALDSTGLRIEFFRPDEGMKVYHLGRGIIMDLAEEAGVLYKVDRSCVINKELFDQNLQNYKAKDELNRLKEESITQNKKLAELSTAELAEVSGGGEDVTFDDIMKCIDNGNDFWARELFTLVQYTLPPKELYTIRMTFWMKFHARMLK